MQSGKCPPSGESKATVTVPSIPAELPKQYDPKAVEQRLYAWWESSGVFHEEPDPARPPFIICMPPPNVTGRAHLGHGSTYTPMDVLVRYHRMRGDNADWLPGLDHAAIATEAVLVRELAREGLTRESLGRERYLERAWRWATEYGGTIEKQFRLLGFGPDWQRSRFTMDEGLSAAVRALFVRLHRDGLVYRGKRLVNWDPVAKTTISDAEIDHDERDGTLWFVRYPAADGSDTSIVVATTRPETMLGDVAVAVHPQDERYRALIGREVLVPPFCERRIPVIADDAVDPSFGTGAVKVTPAHDPTDYEIGLRHGLPMPSIMDVHGRISGAELPVGPYDGLDRFEARERIVRDLRARGLLVEERPHRHAVGISERSGAVIEPMLSEQWFVRMEPLARPALDAYRFGKVRFFPERYGRIFEQWLENIRDWNVSRQVWWGHRLPVWYTGDGTPIVAETEEEARAIARERYGDDRIEQDPDTLDTWFSSGLWPFSILGWPKETLELRCWYPSQVLVTGWEIIFLWVARMVMLGLYVMGEVPFPHVFVAPLVFDAHGRKMSKSLGNAIDPMDLVDRYGADAVRMGILRQMRLESQELRFQESRCEEARNFNNKIWNATRYMLSLPEGLPAAGTLPAVEHLTLPDRWILARLHRLVSDLDARLESYDFGGASDALWRFIWYEFCDWYVEATKAEPSRATRAAVLSFVWNAAMRLLHPIEPFITEEVWQALPHDGTTIVTASWPDPDEIPCDRSAEECFEMIRLATERVRNQRAEAGLRPRDRAECSIPANVPAEIAAWIAHHAGVIPVEAPATGTSLEQALDAIALRVPPAVLRERAEKERVRLQAEIARAEGKLSNAAFVRNAPPDVVDAERAKLERYRAEFERVTRMLADMGEPS
jgi:valyl-tRNA synthetase